MKRLQKVGTFFLLFLTLDAFAQVQDKIEALATKRAHSAAEDLSHMGKDILPALKNALNHSNLQVRQFVTAILCDVDLPICKTELKQKILSKKVSADEKLFYASFLYSARVEEGKDFLLTQALVDKNLQALRILVDGYDPENVSVFFSLLKENIADEKKEPNEKEIEVVNLCVRGINISGTQKDRTALEGILASSNYNY